MNNLKTRRELLATLGGGLGAVALLGASPLRRFNPHTSGPGQGPYTIKKLPDLGAELIDGVGAVLWKATFNFTAGTQTLSSYYLKAPYTWPMEPLTNEGSYGGPYGSTLNVDAYGNVSYTNSRRGYTGSGSAKVNFNENSAVWDNTLVSHKLPTLKVPDNGLHIPIGCGQDGICVPPPTSKCQTAQMSLDMALAAVTAAGIADIAQVGIDPLTDAAFFIALGQFYVAYNQEVEACGK